MGNCCGKQSSNNFEGDGRTLGSVPPSQPVNARVTPAQPPKRNAYTPTPAGGRTLGSSVDAGRNDPKSAAARAAEERAKAGQGKGKLGRQLDAQKAQTQYGTLAAASAENRAVRDADAAAEARNWN